MKQNPVDKCEAMIKWFDGRELPESPLQLNPHTKILDVPKFVDRNISAMARIMKTAHLGVELNILRVIYLRLYELKKHIEQNGNEKTK